MAQESWEKTLYALTAAEFVAMTAFSFVGAFLPLFVQELGNFTPAQAAFWTGIASSGLGIGMFFSSSLWGIASDRWGRKLMVLRVMLGGAVLLVVQGLSPNIYFFVATRWGQGLLTGSVAAVSAMATSIVPRNKIPLAAGLITASASGGSSLGPVIGGFLADQIGYRNAFFVVGALLLASALLVIWLVKEDFEPPARRETASLGGMLRLAVSRDMLPVLIFLFAVSFIPSLTSPIIPLFIKELNPAGRAATAAGLTFGITGAVYTLSTLGAARLSERFDLRKILILSCLGSGLLTLPPVWAASVGQLLIYLVLGCFPGGGVSAASNAVVGLSVSQGQMGMAYGLSNSAGSLGWGLGPLVGGWLASIWGFRPIFAITAGLTLVGTVFVVRFLPKRLFPAFSTQSESVTLS